jgi:hypothetical protein
MCLYEQQIENEVEGGREGGKETERRKADQICN